MTKSAALSLTEEELQGLSSLLASQMDPVLAAVHEKVNSAGVSIHAAGAWMEALAVIQRQKELLEMIQAPAGGPVFRTDCGDFHVNLTIKDQVMTVTEVPPGLCAAVQQWFASRDEVSICFYARCLRQQLDDLKKERQHLADLVSTLQAKSQEVDQTDYRSMLARLEEEIQRAVRVLDYFGIPPGTMDVRLQRILGPVPEDYLKGQRNV